MLYRYSLFVNGLHLGPYERRMIVGMCVKKIVSKAQQIQRDDGLDMTVAELLEDRLEAKRLTSTHVDLGQLSRLGAPSSGMWPQFSVRFGGGPIKPGALGFSGSGQVNYHGDELRFKGHRRNANLGMSRQEEKLALVDILSATTEGCFIEVHTKTKLANDFDSRIRIECVTAHEAQELCSLLNLPMRQQTHRDQTAR